MVKYTKIDNPLGLIIQAEYEDGTISFIPIDNSNSDYQAYLNTLASESANDPAGNK